MPPQPPHEIYSTELVWSGYGYPLWYPEPDDNKGEVEIGDVGFIRDGAFTRVFNICQDSNSPTNKGKVPENFKRLEYDAEDLLRSRSHAIQGSVCSRTVVLKKVKAHVDGGTVISGGEIRYEYTDSKAKAAVLLLKDSAHMQLLQHNTHFPNFIKEHHQDWCRYIKEVRGFDVDPSDVIVVRGWYKTDQWTVAAVDRSTCLRASSAQIFLSLPAGEAGAGLDVEHTVAHGPGAMRRTGPKRRQIGLSVPDRSAPPTSPSSHPPPCDQCVFLPHYKVKYRKWPRQMKIEAAAGDHSLPDSEDDPDLEGTRHEAIVSTDVDDVCGSPRPTDYAPLDILLDYILENSDADFAIACEDDIFPSQWPVSGSQPGNNFRQWLKNNKPQVKVERGAGTLSREQTDSVENQSLRVRHLDLSIPHPPQPTRVIIRRPNHLGPSDQIEISEGSEGRAPTTPVAEVVKWVL